MSEASLTTLLHPFATGLIAAPDAGARVLFVNAPARFELPFEAADLLAVQDFRPGFRALEAAGRRVAPKPEGEAYDLALVLIGRHRGQNEIWIAEALARTRAGGRIVVAGGKTEGAASLRKRIAALLALDGHAPRNHGVVFWLTRPPAPEAAIEALRTANPALVIEGGFCTVPGLFSHERIDPGSRLLAENLPGELGGAVADFGAGWGYLAAGIARIGPRIDVLDLYEASFAACAAAQANMAALAPAAPARVFWRDIAAEPAERRYDTIVTNPPFHTGRAAEPALGEAMIRAAANALVPGGRLVLVANLGLPYEKTLAGCFARHGETVRDTRFKVLWAVR